MTTWVRERDPQSFIICELCHRSLVSTVVCRWRIQISIPRDAMSPSHMFAYVYMYGYGIGTRLGLGWDPTLHIHLLIHPASFAHTPISSDSALRGSKCSNRKGLG